MLKGFGIVSGLTLISRFLGFISWSIVARVIGAGREADAFFVAFKIPNMLRSMLAEGAFSAGFIPVLSQEFQHGKERAKEIVAKSMGMLLTLSLIVSILGCVFAKEVIMFVAVGFTSDPEQFETAVLLLRVMLPYITFVSLISLINGALNTVNKYGAAAIAQIVMNLVTIIGSIIAGYYAPAAAVRIMAYFVIIGGIIQVLVQIPAMQRSGFSLIPNFHLQDPAIRKILKLMIPAVLSAAIYQVSIFINTILASLLEDGSISWLAYADRLTQLPIGLFTIALASVLLPTLSNAAAKADDAGFKKNLDYSLRFSSFFMIPVSFILWQHSDLFVRVLFEYGAFDAYSSKMSAIAVKAMALGLWGASCASMLSRAFLAKKDSFTPSIIAIISITIGILISIILMGEPKHSDQSLVTSIVLYIQKTFHGSIFDLNLSHAALAASSGIASTLAFLLLLLTLILRESLEINHFVYSTFKSILAAIVMFYSAEFLTQNISGDYLNLFISIPISMLIFLITSAFLKSKELKETLSITARFRK